MMFVDLMMPVMDGAELVQLLLTVPEYAAIPVVTFLAKPVRYEALRREVETYCA